MSARWGALLGALTLVACGGGMNADDAGVDGGCSDCDDGLFCNGTETCEGAMCTAGDPPCGTSPCDEETLTCPCEVPDGDGDGTDASDCGGGDCDDDDAARYPGNTEICDIDGHDEDCDPFTFGVRDQDGDLEPDIRCCNTDSEAAQHCGIDCDDSLAGVNTTAAEVCNGRDDDCDALVDEAVERTFWPDMDSDGFGDGSGTSMMGCNPATGWVENAGDCDDGNTYAHSTTAPEICDSQDNDCDGLVDDNTAPTDWYVDTDGDGFGSASDTAPVSSCVLVAGHATNNEDCNDGVATINPITAETCNGIDDDCDGMADDGVRDTFCRDVDSDGHGNPSQTMLGCPLSPPTGYTSLCDDCLDASTAEGIRTYPGATEICNNWDENCSSTGGATLDEDHDRDGVAGELVVCTGGLPHDDCNDNDARAYPGQDAYFGTPYCAAPSHWCAAAGCCVTTVTCGSSTACAAGIPEFWDFNCNDVVEHSTDTGDCSRGCQGGWTSIRTARCGTPRDYTSCLTDRDGNCFARPGTRPEECR